MRLILLLTLILSHAKYVVFTVSLGIAGSSRLSAQYVFRGTVTESAIGRPLQGVTVSANKIPVAVTDSNGLFQFDRATERQTISFSHIGYQLFSADYTAGQEIVVHLSHEGSTLEETIVRAFERNTQLKDMPATVSLLKAADLQRYSNTSILPAVNTVPGVKMDERSPGSYRLSIRGNLLRSPFGVRT